MSAFGARESSEVSAPTWMPVPGHEANYEVSDQGQIRSRPRPRTKGGLLRMEAGKVGYPKVSLSTNGRQETHFVHWIVAAAFLGPRPDGQEIRHLDGNPLNCALSNLAYGTRSENVRDKRRHGTDHNVNKTHCPQGHPYDDVNTARHETHRRCRTCANYQARLRYRQQKASANQANPNWTPGGAS